jgi:uncharacterized membrane protein YgcG
MRQIFFVFVLTFVFGNVLLFGSELLGAGFAADTWDATKDKVGEKIDGALEGTKISAVIDIGFKPKPPPPPEPWYSGILTFFKVIFGIGVLVVFAGAIFKLLDKIGGRFGGGGGSRRNGGRSSGGGGGFLDDIDIDFD